MIGISYLIQFIYAQYVLFAHERCYILQAHIDMAESGDNECVLCVTSESLNNLLYG